MPFTWKRARPSLWVTLLALLMSVMGNARSAGPAVAVSAPRHTARLATLAATASPLRPGALASSSLHLVGLRLAAPTNRIDVPKDAPFSVPVGVWIGDHQASPAEAGATVPTGASLTGILTGPGISSPLTVTGNLASGLSLPGLTAEGDFTLSDIRLVKGGATVLEADPKTVSIHCLGDIIISSVTSTPMTMQELRDAGVQLQPGNYEGHRFTMALGIGSQQVNLTVPVAVPIYNGLEDPVGGGQVGRLEISGLAGGVSLPDLSVVVANILPEKDPFNLSRPSISHALRNNFKALIVIPGSIGYLHQFYKVNLVVFNALDASSPFQITHLSTTLNLPPGGDGAIGTLDDPLRLANREGETDSINKPVRGPGADGTAGTGTALLKGGEAGMATFFVEALKEGAHQLNFDIRGQFEGGGLSAPVPLIGHAQGKLLVRNPTFSLVLVHPDIVRRGEEYTLEARLTNTSKTLSNGVTVTLDRSRLGSVKLVEDLNKPVDTLNPGDTAIFKFKLRALRNGEVRSSYLYMEQGTIGFQLSTGLGERNIRLNPDTLVLPQTLEGRKGLPLPLREAMLRVLGQAYSVASTKGALPPGVLPIAMSTVTGQMSQDLSEQGLFLKMGIDKARVWMRLWEMFIQNADKGIDQLVRTTDSGRELRKAFMDVWTWADPSHPMSERLADMAPWNQAFGGMTVAVVEGARPGLGLELQDPSDNRAISANVETKDLPYLPQPHTAWGGSDARQWISMPSAVAGARLKLVNRGTESQALRLATVAPVAGKAPTYNDFTFVVEAGQWVVVTLGGAREGSGALFASDGHSLGGIYPAQTSDLQAEPFKVLAVHRYDIDLDPAATPYGTHVMMLFNRPTMALNLPSGIAGFNAAKALVQVEANAPWRKVMSLDPEAAPDPVTGEYPPPPGSPPALFKAYARVASLYLERPVGPYVPRQLTLGSTWADAQGNSLTGDLSWPILCGDIPGGALVRGKVRKANGVGLPAKLTYWYQAHSEIGNVDLATGYEFLQERVEFHYALVTNLETEADGSYQLDYVPEPVSFAVGPMLLQGATAEGTAFAQASVLGNGQLIEMDLVLEGKGSVDGYVLSAAGAPVSGAQVQVIQEQPSNPMTRGTGGGTFSQSTMTDANGHYRVDNLKAGVFSIRVLKDLFGAAASNEISRDGETVHQNVVLEAPTGTLKARLLDTNGNVLLAQVIRLGVASGLMRSSGSAARLVWPEQATPEADGWVTFSNVPAGDVGLMAPGLALGTVTEWRGFLDSGTSKEITLKMLPPSGQAYAHFMVVDAAGNPVQGVYLSRDPAVDGPAFAITDENGLAPKRPVPMGGSFQVYGYHPAWPGRTPSESVVVQPGEDRLIRTTMPPRGSLHGTVKYPDGTPVKGAYVAIPPVFDDMKKNRLAISDSTGAFVIPNVQVGSPFRLVSVGPELRTAMVPMNIQVTDGQDLTLALTLPFVGKNQVSGVIYQPLEGAQKIPTMAQVWMDGLLPEVAPLTAGNMGWGLLRRETTGAISTGVEGKFTFTGLPQGTFTLHANSDFFPVEVKSDGDFAENVNEVQTRDIFLSSSFAGELKGVITKRDGQTPVAPDVRVRLIGGTIGELIIFSTEGGKYHFPKVIPEGCYKLRVEDPVSGDIAVAKVEMKKESSQVKNLRLWGKGTLTVNVQDSFGRILPEGVITLTHSKDGDLGCPLVAILDADDMPPMAQKLKPEMEGVLVFDDLLAGPISIGLKNPTGLQGMASASIPEGGGNAEVVVRLQPVGDVLGTLYRADGTLISAGRVDAYQGGRWLGVSPTRMDGVNGRFRFQVLPTGPISLEAWDPDSRQMGKGVVNVVAGETSDISITTHDKGPMVVTVTQEGQAVAGAAIRLVYRGGDALDFSTESTSDANGKATYYVPPGDYTATATDRLSLAVGSVSFSRAVDQGEIQTAIVLQAVRSLWATALPPPGAPAGFSLEGWILRDTAMGRLTQLDAKGQGMLRDLPVGSRVLTLTDLRGRLRGNFTITLTAEGSAVQAPAAPLRAIAYGNLDVTVVDAHGQPAPNVAVSTSSGGCIYTDATGLARLLGLRAGNLSLWAAGAFGTALLQQEGETVRAELHLHPTASIHGTVFDPLGQPMRYFLVNVGALQTATDDRGQFRVSGLGLGTYTVSALSSAGRLAWVNLTLDLADQDSEVRLDLKARDFTTFSGRIRRAKVGNVWPAGTKAYLVNQSYDLDSDGTLLQPTPRPQVDFGDGATDVYVNLPNGSRLTIGFLNLVRNGETVLDLTAPGFGSLYGTVKFQNGSPAADVLVRGDGWINLAATTDASGAWQIPIIAPGFHHVVAQASTSIAGGDVTLAEDGGSAEINLTLAPNTVALPVNMTVGRLGYSARIEQNGSLTQPNEFHSGAFVSVDGASEVAPSPLNGIAQWIEQDRQLVYTSQVGPLEVSIIRTVAPGAVFVKEEIRFRNTDSDTHRVMLRNAMSLYSLQGVPSGEALPVLAGTSRDAGVVSYQGTFLWGNGAVAPASVDSGGIQWPDLTIAPGEAKTIAMAYAPYQFIPNWMQASRFRKEGAIRLMDRSTHGAPEWVYGSDPASWVNWLPPQDPAAPVLAAWDGTLNCTLKDAFGHKVINQINATFLPKESLASTSIILTSNDLPNQPRDGGQLSLTLPGNPGVLITRDLPVTGMGDILAVEGISLSANVHDSHGNPVVSAHLVFPFAGSDSTDASGHSGLWLMAPGTYDIRATMPNSENTVQAIGRVALAAGQSQVVDIVFPAVGGLQVSILGPRGLLYSGGVQGYVRSASGIDRWASTTDGTLNWPNMLPGNYSVFIQDPRTVGGYLVPIPVTIGADSVTQTTARLLGLGTVQVFVLDPIGNRVPRGQNITIRGADGGSQNGSTDGSDTVVFSNLTPGIATISVTNNANGFSTSVLVNVLDGQTVSSSIQLPGSGSLQITLATADGRPVANRYLSVQRADTNSNVRSGYTDPNGRLTLGPLPTNASLLLLDAYGNAADPFNPKAPQIAFTLTQQGEVQNKAITLPVGTLRVLIREAATGNPLPNAWVWYRTNGNASTSTDANGMAIFNDVALDTDFTIGVNLSGYQSAQTNSVSVSSTQPAGTLTLDLTKLMQISFNVIRANGADAPWFYWWGYRYWYYHLTAPAANFDQLQHNTLFSYTWSNVPPGEYTAEAYALVGTGKDGSVQTSSGPTWPWKAKTQVSLNATNMQPALTLQLPALAAWTLHLKGEDGLPMVLDRALILKLKASTVPGYMVEAVPFNPTQGGTDLAMAEHFPEGTHSFSVVDTLLGELTTVDLVVKPEHDAHRVEQDLKVPAPRLAALTLHLRDARGQLLQLDHGLQLTLKSSTRDGYALNVPIPGSDPACGLQFPEGSHVFAIVDPAFGEVQTFDLTVGPGDIGNILERTVNLPYVHGSWTVSAVAGDGKTPALGTSISLRGTDSGFWMDLATGDTVFLEVPNTRPLQIQASFQPFGNLPQVNVDGNSRTLVEGDVINETLQLPLTVARFRLLDQDGQTPLADQAGCLVLANEDARAFSMPLWTDAQGAVRLLLLGQPETSAQNIILFDSLSGLGKATSVQIPALGQALDSDQQIPAYAWLQVKFTSKDGDPFDYFDAGVASSFPGIVAPWAAQWNSEGNAQLGPIRVPAGLDALWTRVWNGEGGPGVPQKLDLANLLPGETRSVECLETQNWMRFHLNFYEAADTPIDHGLFWSSEPSGEYSGWEPYSISSGGALPEGWAEEWEMFGFPDGGWHNALPGVPFTIKARVPNYGGHAIEGTVTDVVTEATNNKEVYLILSPLPPDLISPGKTQAPVVRPAAKGGAPNAKGPMAEIVYPVTMVGSGQKLLLHLKKNLPAPPPKPQQP